MIQFLEHFLSWIGAEIVVSGLLFLSYHLWAKRLPNPLDRFNFLRLSFGALLCLPWIPAPVISEPIVRNWITEATMALQGNGNLAGSDWVRNLMLWALPAAIPLAYFSTLLVRAIRIMNAYLRVNQIATSGILVENRSHYPVILHRSAIPPMTIGLWNPKILIPKSLYDTLSEADVKMILQHEEEHIRRCDGLSNLFRIVIREVLFFSPFIWSLSKKFEEEMEISVDMAVLAKDGISARAYGRLLVSATQASQVGENPAHMGAYLSSSSLKRRILSMKNVNSRGSKILSGLALGLFVAIGTLGVSVFGTQAYSASNRVELYLMDASSGTAEPPRGKPVLTDSDFSSASIQPECPDSQGKCTLSLQLLPESQKRFSKLTANNVGKKIGIVVGGKMISAPVVKSAITGPDFQITTDFSKYEAVEIVKNIGSKFQ